MTRFVFMMLDGVGIGELPDAAAYGDVGSNTLGNVAAVVDMHLPNLGALGLGNIAPLRNIPPVASPSALVGRLAPTSAGKDTTVGHWEHMGVITPRPFPTYPEGFPEDVLSLFRLRIGRDVLGNKPASGTAIIEELGREHLVTGNPIVYTSADSVFQIASHVDIIPLEQLYEWCQIARDILQGDHAVARVIARPFTGPPEAFVRTKDRRDFSLAPPSPTYLDLLHEVGVPVVALGKISEIFVGRGVTASIKVGSNAENLALLLELLTGRSDRGVFSDGLLFTNLVDFDMVWGHRNDPDGFAAGLEEVDRALPGILAALGPDDRLIITADHGVDPTTVSTDHSREYVPLLYYPRPTGAADAVFEGMFSDTGATAYAWLTKRGPALAGQTFASQDPARGWSRYTPAVPSPMGDGQLWPARVGAEEAGEAARWLQTRCGVTPAVAVILGSGQSGLFGAASHWTPMCAPIPYDEIPWWRSGSVTGHSHQLDVMRTDDRVVAILRGRLHAYEGFDLGELQLPVRTLAAWGVKKIVLACSAGGLSPAALPGSVVIVREIIDFQSPDLEGYPGRLWGTDARLADRLLDDAAVARVARPGVYAAVPGPQYETMAENDVLQGLGADCVGMSLAAEVRAARETCLDAAVFALITNAGPTSHDSVLTAAGHHSMSLLQCVLSALAAWT